jgi:spore maturation protein CgeB
VLAQTTPPTRRALNWTRPPYEFRELPAKLSASRHSAVYGLEMFRVLAESRITLNAHIALSADSASNMRLFEATGVGACLLTDWKPDLHEIFEPEVEVVTYTSPEDCVAKARRLLSDEGLRSSIAAAGQRRTLRDHTFDVRARDFDTTIRDRLPRLVLP